jgi:protoporphyrinogen oxidase
VYTLFMQTVVVIGAGPAGLSAAYELLKQSQDYNVLVLEKSNAIGGISQTINYNGNRMDIGGHRFFTKSKRVLDMWNEVLKPQGAPAKDELLLGAKREYDPNGIDPEEFDDVMLLRRRVSRIYYNKKFFDYPISLKFSTIKNIVITNCQ